jgi:hypothetical protein
MPYGACRVQSKLSMSWKTCLLSCTIVCMSIASPRTEADAKRVVLSSVPTKLLGSQLSMQLPEGATLEPTEYYGLELTQWSYKRSGIELSIVAAETYSILGPKPVDGIRADASSRGLTSQLVVDRIELSDGVLGYVARPKNRDLASASRSILQIVYVPSDLNTTKAISFLLRPANDRSYNWEGLIREMAKTIRLGKSALRSNSEQTICNSKNCAMTIKLPEMWTIMPRLLKEHRFLVVATREIGRKAPFCEITIHGQIPSDASSFLASEHRAFDGSSWKTLETKDSFRAFVNVQRSPGTTVLLYCEAPSRADLESSIRVTQELKPTSYYD